MIYDEDNVYRMQETIDYSIETTHANCGRWSHLILCAAYQQRDGENSKRL